MIQETIKFIDKERATSITCNIIDDEERKRILSESRKSKRTETPVFNEIITNEDGTRELIMRDPIEEGLNPSDPLVYPQRSLVPDDHYDNHRYMACDVLFGGKALYDGFIKMMESICDEIVDTVDKFIPYMFFGYDTIVKFKNENGEFEKHSIKNEIAKLFKERGIYVQQFKDSDTDQFHMAFEAHDPFKERYPIVAIVLDGTSLTAREVHDLYVGKYIYQFKGPQILDVVSPDGYPVYYEDASGNWKRKKVRHMADTDHYLDPEVMIVLSDVLKYLGNGQIAAKEYSKQLKTAIHYNYQDYLNMDDLDSRDEVSLELAKSKPNLTKEHLPQLYEADYPQSLEMNIDRDLDGSYDWVRRRNRYLRMTDLNENHRKINERYQYPTEGDLITFFDVAEFDTFGSMYNGTIHTVKKTPTLPRASNKSRTLKIDGTDILMIYLCTSIGSAYHSPFTRANSKKVGFHGVYAYAISDNDLHELDSCDFSAKIVGPHADYGEYYGALDLPFVERCRLYRVHMKCDICGFEKIPEHFSGVSFDI